MSNRHQYGNLIRFSMRDYDALPAYMREILANAPLSFGINKKRYSAEMLKEGINRKVREATLRDYGPDHPQVDYDYYPKITKHGIQLNKLNIEI